MVVAGTNYFIDMNFGSSTPMVRTGGELVDAVELYGRGGTWSDWWHASWEDLGRQKRMAKKWLSNPLGVHAPP